jgi:hypothetical protein
MSKFNVGDRVRRTNYSFGEMRIGDEGIINKICTSGAIMFDGDDWEYDPTYFELVEPEFEWGEEVEVRDSKNVSWIKRKFVGINPNENNNKYIVVSGGGRPWAYKYCRNLKKELTLQEIADKFELDVNELRIKE